MADRSDVPEPQDGPRDAAPDRPSTDKPIWGTTPSQTISRVLLVLGVLLMLWVVYVIVSALG
jgi:hypothetical protein